ncbi:MAG: D-alanine--D-alanine ligase [Proteobacteria bacterium]|nr:D-alanine--D-alanine ligase [Pseudomonadota bacterium]MBU1449836.1 D-alanine--D-alanine ligase [Pseudomonadota bacterium]MBU2467976.1 D-alanine--D-alanine ligase [Pseudomonadota bacterium]MBU2516610.1 D-alanine--D-alanine ligase [Pseudomonadota bacterium]
MLVGITYDLRSEYLAKGYSEEEVAEFDSPRTVEGIEQALLAAGHQAERIGSLPSLVGRLAQGERWDLVFNIAEGLGLYGREAQVPALLEYYGVPYTFADPLTLCLTLHKGMAKRVVRDLGLATPDFAVVTDPREAAEVDLPYPLFVKPVAEGTGRGIGAASKVKVPEELTRACAELIGRYRQPVLVETYLPGREFTVGIVGTGAKARVIGVMEVTLRAGADQDAYTWRNKEECDDLVRYRRVKGSLAGQAGELALAAWRGLGCRDAGRVDLRCDAQGLPSFLEVNPLAGLHPEHSDLPILCSLVDYPYQKLIERIVASAWERAQENARPQTGHAAGHC